MEKILYTVKNFEGPLDLLLHLISKNKFDIMDLKISEILEQYLDHIAKMKELDMDISSEFLEMAARLIYMKTMSLLPKEEVLEELKKELQGQLIEYKECKRYAELMLKLIDFDSFVRKPVVENFDMVYTNIHKVEEIFEIYKKIEGVKRAKKESLKKEYLQEIVSKKVVSVTSKIFYILRCLVVNEVIEYDLLFDSSDTKSDMIALFLAVLELARSKRILLEGRYPSIKLRLVREKRE